MARNTFGQKLRAVARFGQKALKSVGRLGSKLYSGVEKLHDVVGAVKPLGEMSYALAAPRLTGQTNEDVYKKLEGFNEKYNTLSDFRNRVDFAKYKLQNPTSDISDYY